VQTLGCDRLALLHLLAQRHGIDLPAEADTGQWLIPFTYRRLPVLSLHALEFELPHRPPRNAHYVGPLLLEHRGDEPLDAAQRSALDALYARRRGDGRRGDTHSGDGRRGNGRRLLYAAFGSFFTADPSLLRRLLAAMAERPDWDLILSFGGRSSPEGLGPLPSNVHPFRWLPQPQVLAQVDAAITHGGINSIDECILGGVPMLIYCGGETDMAGNTARVVHHGLGIAGNPRRDTPQVIGQHLDRLLGDPQLVHNVRRMRSRYLAYAEQQVAEETVQFLLDEAASLDKAPSLDRAPSEADR
jgi:UDP:flavonoid glycosyltransferase YjiC (YdhE family)